MMGSVDSLSNPSFNEVTFNDLNVYVLEDVLKYLTLSERVKFERVTKEWADTLDMMWTQQMVLSFSLVEQMYPKNSFDCSQSSHQMRANDDLDLRLIEGKTPKESCSSRQMDVMINVVTRCVQLKAIYFDIWPDLFSLFDKKCPFLEHIESLASNPFHGEFKGRKYLKCVPFNIRVQHQDLSFLREFPSMENLNIVIKNDEETRHLNAILPQLKNFSVTKLSLVNEVIIKNITDFGNNLVKLYLNTDVLQEAEVERICDNLLLLESIRITSDLKNIRFLRNLKYLNEIQWFDYAEEYDDEDEYEEEEEEEYEDYGYYGHVVVEAEQAIEVAPPEIEEAQVEDKEESQKEKFKESQPNASQYFKWFVRRNGNKLTSISFNTRLHPQSLLEITLNYCPNLVKFNGRFDTHEEPTLINNIFNGEASCPRLRGLTLINIKVTKEGVVNLLEACPKLRSCQLRDDSTDAIFTEIEGLFKGYAEQHPKRIVTLTIHDNDYEFSRHSGNFIMMYNVIQ